MVFSSPIFLFFFLPIVLVAYLIVRKEMHNTLLLAASLLFYSWGEPVFVLVMLLSILVNYLFGLWMEKCKVQRSARIVLILSVLFNLGLLCFFKYIHFILDNLNLLFRLFGSNDLHIGRITLPIGISFFTFQIMSYVIDVYRKEVKVQKSLMKLALYISLFPQLIAGPIVRYSDVADQMDHRDVTLEGIAYGIKRFIMGLGKKVLIANSAAVAADGIFGLPSSQLTTGMAWLGILCYTLQIYYDFSGYSDMAIGLGHMFGFRFMENFHYPYISRSIKEFWRRWHISLSTWFRDYLYIPLGGNRCSPVKAYFNLIIVFLLCGLWHGASWNFAVWGLFHGLFLVLERLRFGKLLESMWIPLRHVYVLLVVMFGWVFFRSESLSAGLGYFKALFGFGDGLGKEYFAMMYINRELLVAVVLGVLGAMPVIPAISGWNHSIISRFKNIPGRIYHLLYRTAGIVFLMLVFGACALSLASGTYNPFIYFRF